MVKICPFGKVEDATVAERVLGKGRLQVEGVIDASAVTLNL